jgi:hypothetical protein
MRPRDPYGVQDGLAMSARLIAIAKNQERFFGPEYQELPKKKLVSLQKWLDRAKDKGRRYQVERAVDFMMEVERCISGELRFLLEMSGLELPEKLFSRLDSNDIPDLQAYWKEGNHPGGLKETYDRFKEGKLLDKTSSGSLRLPHNACASKVTFPEQPRKRARTQKSSTEVNSEPEPGMSLNFSLPPRNKQLC